MTYEKLETDFDYNGNEPLGNFHSYSPYSKSAERTDNYGYSVPNTEMVYGNMYRRGMSVNESVIGEPYRNRSNIRLEDEMEDFQEGLKPLKGEPRKKEKFTTVGTDDEQDTTPIENYDEIESTTDKRKKRRFDMYIKIFLLIIFFLGVAYWLKTSDNLLQKYFFKDVQIQWYHLLLIAVMLTLIFIFVLNISKMDVELIKRKD